MDLQKLKGFSEITTEESEILKMISDSLQTIYLKDKNKFYQSMYRLDVHEFHIEQFERSMSFSDLSKKIWERQKKKMKNW